MKIKKWFPLFKIVSTAPLMWSLASYIFYIKRAGSNLQFTLGSLDWTVRLNAYVYVVPAQIMQLFEWVVLNTMLHVLFRKFKSNSKMNNLSV